MSDGTVRDVGEVPAREALTKGLVAGLVGGAAMALWFLVIDGSRGEPFQTPAFLAHALLGIEIDGTTLGPVLAYSAIHFGAWMAVGVVVAWLLTLLGTASPVLLGLALGFALFDIVFYASVAITGVDIIAELGWPEVLVGNLVAGVSLFGFLHVTGFTKPVQWWDTLVHNRVVREGVVCGLIGAGVVAVWFLIFDFARGQPFFTPGALGSALFLGVESMDAIRVSFGTVFGYTFFHVLAFIGVGLVAATIAAAADETPALVLAAVLLFAVFEAFFMGVLAMLAEFLLGALAWWTIALGNLLAAVSMGWYLWRCHPLLRKALEEDPLDKAD